MIPLALVLLCLVKKLTVIGIIGNTQGVNNAANPLANESAKIAQTDMLSVSLFTGFLSSFLGDFVVFKLSVSSTSETGDSASVIIELSSIGTFKSSLNSGTNEITSDIGVRGSSFKPLIFTEKSVSKGGKQWVLSHV